MPPQLLTLTELQSRFVYPFFFDGHRLADALAALSSSSMCGRTDVWQRARPAGAYKDEIHRHAVEFLFPEGDERGRCGYLKVADGTLNALFPRSLEVQWGKHEPLPVQPEGSGIELFLAPFGVGVLSLTLRPTASPIACEVALDFNYRLAQLHRKVCAQFRIPHPAEDAERWQRLPESARQAIPAAPAATDSLDKRLGARGGQFTLEELILELLRPLAPFGLQETQPQLSVYSVARFGPEVDLADQTIRDQISPLVSALAQIEEPGHAGAPSDIPGTANAILNRRHWSAVTYYGATHLVSDQPADAGSKEHPFNQQRVPRVRDKYFIPFLLSTLQSRFLHRTIHDAAALAYRPMIEASGRLAEMRSELLKFTVGCHFPQISNRHAVQRFYELARTGLNVPDAWEEVHHAIAELDASYGAVRQQKIAADMAENLEVVARTQSMVEWIEIFLVSVYAAHLSEIVFSGWLGDNLKPIVSHIALALAIVGGLITALILKPWKHAAGHHK